MKIVKRPTSRCMELLDIGRVNYTPKQILLSNTTIVRTIFFSSKHHQPKNIILVFSGNPTEREKKSKKAVKKIYFAFNYYFKYLILINTS